MVRIVEAKPEVYPALPEQPWLLSDGMPIVDSCYDSRGTRFGRACRALNGLLRLIRDAWNPLLGRPEFVTLLIVFLDFTDADAVWTTETVEAVQKRLDRHFDEISRWTGCGPMPRLDKVESCSGRSGIVHAHLLVSRSTAQRYTRFNKTNAAGGETDLRLKHLDAWEVLPNRVLLTYTYFHKCRDARALRPQIDGRTREEKENGTRDAMAARQTAIQLNAAQGRRRIKSALRFRHVPRNSQPLDEWTRAAILGIATGTAPCWTGMSFSAYLHRLARHLRRKAHEVRQKTYRSARLARLAEGRAARQARELELKAVRRERHQARLIAARGLSGTTAATAPKSARWSAGGPMRVPACAALSNTTHPSRGRHGLARARAPPGHPWPSLLPRRPRSRPTVSRPITRITRA